MARHPNNEAAQWIWSLGGLGLFIIVVRFAPEALPILMFPGFISLILASQYGPPRPVWRRNRKDMS